jgi:hypothetical protein
MRGARKLLTFSRWLRLLEGPEAVYHFLKRFLNSVNAFFHHEPGDSVSGALGET